MISVQVVFKDGVDGPKMIRDKITHDAETWSWQNRPKTRLRHNQAEDGYIEVGSAEGVLIAQVFPSVKRGRYYLVEKFVGRLIGWFEAEIVAVNMQVMPEKKRKR
jgi:hypothetical protein